MPYVLFAIMCLIYGTTFLAIKVGLNAGLAPIYSAGVRFVAAALIMLCLLKLSRRLKTPGSAKAWGQITVIALLTTTLCFAGVYWAEQYISSGMAALISAGAPIAIALLYATNQGKKITPDLWLGFALALSGVLLVVLPTLQMSLAWAVLLPMGAVVVGELFYSIGSVRCADLVRGGEVDALSLNAWQSLIGGLGLLLLSAPWEPAAWTNAAWMSQSTAWLSLSFLSVMGTVVAASIYFWLIERMNPVFASLWLYISPVIAVVVGAMVLHEPIGNTTLPGTALIVCGVFLANNGLPLMRQWMNRRLQPSA
ncbi:DMT family transporter [Acanthopleuribacter pedis]|uniref:EamA family transporter n=1 Tax=Acanthopleuribacter pedis TaxID=442870 RepID=A0A8J7QR84_9BACT|nr:EamA family transporter [Acanthopleuribacter pedis]MBO1322735.1 EamA family transporter [Acanthopleuribacter pedis]